MLENNLPYISIVMATLNASSVLPLCLKALNEQDYPKDKVELVVGDGGSTDGTIRLIEEFGGEVFHNPLKTAESGKAVALKNATGEFVVLLDSDNILPNATWLRQMIRPLVSSPELIGAEPIRYTHRWQDGFIDRYCALIGMNDPLCLWVGNYDRFCTLTGKWTEIPIETKDRDDYLELTLESGKLPTIGANGAIFRKSIFENNPELVKDYLFDIDVVEELVAKKGPQKFAKVKVGIVHLYCGSDLKKFARKQLRRIKDMLYRRSVTNIFITKKRGERRYNWSSNSLPPLEVSIFKFALSCLLVIPLVYQSFVGYSRKKDLAWFVHPLLCWITLVMYARGTLESFFSDRELTRDNWKQ